MPNPSNDELDTKVMAKCVHCENEETLAVCSHCYAEMRHHLATDAKLDRISERLEVLALKARWDALRQWANGRKFPLLDDVSLLNQMLDIEADYPDSTVSPTKER